MVDRIAPSWYHGWPIGARLVGAGISRHTGIAATLVNGADLAEGYPDGDGKSEPQAGGCT